MAPAACSAYGPCGPQPGHPQSPCAPTRCPQSLGRMFPRLNIGLIWFLRGPSRHGNLQSAPGSSLTIRMRARDEREARDLADGVSSPLTSAQLKTFPKLAAAMGAQWAIVVGEVVSRTVFCPGHSDSAHQGQL